MKIFEDFKAVFDRDPAARGFWGIFDVLLTYPGFHAVILYRIAHVIHRLHIPIIPHVIMLMGRILTGIEIHPAAKIEGGIFIDHGFGVVIGETSEIGKNVTIFQGVSLGGTGKETGKRHPTIGDNVVIGAGAKVLGSITIGNDVYIGANAVVLHEVPDDCTVVGVPGRCVKMDGKRVIGATLRHDLLPDPILARLDELQKEIEAAEEDIRRQHTSDSPSDNNK